MDDVIDYRDIVSKYSFQQHAERADQYFSTVDVNSVVARKPFASVEEASVISAGIGVVLGNLKLFRGAKVLDFGAGTCWLSRILASVGCEVTAADVSRNALDLGKRLADSDPALHGASISYAPIDEAKLPFPDESFDRIVVFDAFHHVPDQKAAIREFHRILKRDGLAAFHEPGPEHSRSHQSQYEMRSFGVIEADIIVEELIGEAVSCGFSSVDLAVFATSPIMVKLGEYNRFLTEKTSMAALNLVEQARAESRHRRVFFLHKGDPNKTDSRAAAGLGGELLLTSIRQDGAVVIDGVVTNTGSSTWLPSMRGVGSVNLGVHLYGQDGSLLDADYARGAVSDSITEPGDRRHVRFIVPLPEVESFTLSLDLVAEGVTWFETVGGRVAKFSF